MRIGFAGCCIQHIILKLRQFSFIILFYLYYLFGQHVPLFMHVEVDHWDKIIIVGVYIELL